MAHLDILIYAFFGILVVMLFRVQPLTRVTVTCGDATLGHILKCHYHLGSKIGLLNTPALAVGDGLLLMGTRSIQTRGMHYPIDVIFLDEARRVLAHHSGVTPGQRKVKGPAGTRVTLELGNGTIATHFPHLQKHAVFEVLG